MERGASGIPNIQLAKTAAKAWVNALPLGQSECAIASFDHNNYFNQDFTKDRVKLLNTIEPLTPSGGTDYDCALSKPLAGGLQASKNGKYQKVIVMLTDGSPNFEPDVENIVKEAKNQNCIIYAVTLGMPAPKCLKDISARTGGQYFENITTIHEAVAVYQKVLAISQGIEPCTIEWESELPCRYESIKADFRIISQGVSASVDYLVTNNSIPKLEFDHLSVRFLNPFIGVVQTQTISVKAINSGVNVKNIRISNSNYDINPKSFVLSQNESATLTLSYKAVDSGFTFCKFDFETDRCPHSYTASAGWSGKKPKVNTLKVTAPNGGEKFLVGSDTVITWTGVASEDLVQLDYSIDKGKTWKYIDTARGLSYKWNKIPKPASDECLVRVSQWNNANKADSLDETLRIIWNRIYDLDGEYSPTCIHQDKDGNYIVVGNKSIYRYIVKYPVTEYILEETEAWAMKLNSSNGDMIWFKTYGGSRFDEVECVNSDQFGNYIVAGLSNSSDRDVEKNRGQTDAWIFKLNSKDGAIIWSHTFGDEKVDWPRSIKVDPDGNYIVVGEKYYGVGFAWIFKLNSENGNVIWSKTYGGSWWFQGNDFEIDRDGNYIIVGNTDLRSLAQGNDKTPCILVLKLSGDDGALIWGKTYCEGIRSIGKFVKEANDGNYLVIGYTDLRDDRLDDGTIDDRDIEVLKFRKEDGEILWKRNYGGYKFDDIYGVEANYNDELIFLADAQSNDRDCVGKQKNCNNWMFKISSYDGDIIWSKFEELKTNIYYKEIKKDISNGFVILGQSYRLNSTAKWTTLPWVTKLSEPQLLQSDISDSVFSIVSPQITARDIDMKKCLLNDVKDSTIVKFNQNISSYPCRVDSIYFKDGDSDCFSLVSGIPQYILNPENSQNTEFRFKPKRVGVHKSQILIIAQADTLYYTIQGEGVQGSIKVVNLIIDFGKNDIHIPKDSSDAVTIQNAGSSTIRIKEVKFGKPNDKDFSSLKSIKPFDLKLNETHKMDLRFLTKEVGRTSGVIEFYYDGIGSPAKVQLYGEGVNHKPIINASVKEYSTLICGSSTVNTITISNSGVDTLRINSIDIEGQDKSDFNLSYPPDLKISPDSSIDLVLNFSPRSIGSKTAELIIKSNAFPDSVKTLTLGGAKDSAAISVDVPEIDLGYLCPGESKEFSTTIRNIGNLINRAKIETLENISILDAPEKLNPEQSQTLRLNWIGDNNLGEKNRKFTISDTVCGHSREVSVKAIIEEIRSTISDCEFEPTALGGTRTGYLKIKNLSVRDISILKIEGAIKPFSLVAGQLPITIGKNSEDSIKIEFQPEDIGTYEEKLTLSGEPCQWSSSATIKGNSVSKAGLSVSDCQGKAGDEVIAEIKLLDRIGINSTSDKANYDLEYNSSLLSPIVGEVEKVSDRRSKLKIRNAPLNVGENEPISKIRFLVGLGDSSSCDLTIANQEIVNSKTELSVHNGKFTLLGICREGGDRLFNPTGKAGIVSLTPNPAKDKITIEVNNIEDGAANLSIYNSMGVELQNINMKNKQGKQIINVDFSEYLNGMYYIRYKSGTIMEMRNFVLTN
jgi:hypothetical protein